MKLKPAHAIVALALAMLCTSAPFAVAQNRTSVGTLTCRLNAGMGLTTNLRQRMRCHHVTTWGRLRAYSGIVAEFDSGTRLESGRVMRWSVLTSTRLTGRDALVGRYTAAGRIGATDSGVRDEDLVGGADRSIVLRASASSRGRSGVNPAPGVKELTIDPRRTPRQRTT